MTALLSPRMMTINGHGVVRDNYEPIVNPADQQVISDAPLGDIATTELAITAARVAFDVGPWTTLRPVERSNFIVRLVDIIDRDRDHHVSTMVAESGATVMLARVMVQLAIDYLTWAAESARRDRMQSLPPNLTSVSPNFSMLGARTIIREPIGVVVGMSPYNSCFVLAAVKLASALAMGNTIILKPSPETLSTAIVSSPLAAIYGAFCGHGFSPRTAR